tara:strand:+ start:316 stop:690 length:375 start_codon:yes stop_codon:yes gene_type:complete
MEYKRTEVVKIDVAVEEEEDNTIRCINCKKELNEKPWISVRCDEDIVHACKYGCAQRLKYYIGTGYWDRVINKEDFPGPRPVIQSKVRKDITTNFGIEEIRLEIEEEEKRIQMIEDYESDDSSN